MALEPLPREESGHDEEGADDAYRDAHYRDGWPFSLGEVGICVMRKPWRRCIRIWGW